MTKNAAGGHTGPFWGAITAVGVALVAGTWALAEKFSGLEDLINSEVRSVEDSIRALRASIVKVDVPETKSEDAALTEPTVMGDASTTALDDLCAGGTTDPNLIRVGETEEGTLTEDDERLDDETYFDLWMLPVCTVGRTTIVIEMTSETLDSYLILSSLPELRHVADDDDGGIWLDARVEADLDRGLYLIAANTASALLAQPTGSYRLTVHEVK